VRKWRFQDAGLGKSDLSTFGVFVFAFWAPSRLRGCVESHTRFN
jgi:hypothetical protein